MTTQATPCRISKLLGTKLPPIRAKPDHVLTQEVNQCFLSKRAEVLSTLRSIDVRRKTSESKRRSKSSTPILSRTGLCGTTSNPSGMKSKRLCRSPKLFTGRKSWKSGRRSSASLPTANCESYRASRNCLEAVVTFNAIATKRSSLGRRINSMTLFKRCTGYNASCKSIPSKSISYSRIRNSTL